MHMACMYSTKLNEQKILTIHVTEFCAEFPIVPLDVKHLILF